MGQIAIRCLRLEIETVSAGDQAGLRDRLTEAVRRDLARGLAGSDLAHTGPDDPALLHVHRLDLNLTVLGEVAPGRIGEELGRRLGRAVTRLAREPDTRTVVYKSPGARLAAYVAALIAGDPTDRWWFSAYDGLALLARPRAIATVLERDPDETAQALRLLPGTAALALPVLLTPQDALHLLESLTLSPGEPTGAMLEAMAASGEPDAPAGAQAAIALLIADLREGGDAPIGARAALANLVAGFWSARRAGTLTRTSQRSLAASAPLPAAAAALLDRLDPIALAAALTAVSAPRSGLKPDGEPSRFMPHANLALVWPQADALPLDRICGGRSPRGCDPHGLATLLLLATLSGPDHALVVWNDPVWRTLCRVPRTIGLKTVRRLFARLPPAKPMRDTGAGRRLRAAERRWLEGAAARLVGQRFCSRLVGPARILLRGFVRRLPGFADATAPFLEANLLRGGGMAHIQDGRVSVTMGRAPLDILLSITRLGDREVRLRDGRLLTLRRGIPA